MTRVLRLLGTVAALSLVAYAAYLLLADPSADDVVEKAIADGREGDDQREAIERSRERLRRTARGYAVSPEGRPDDPSRRGELASAVPYGSGEIDAQSARQGFSYAMDRVDEIVKSRRRLSQEEWDQLYRESNDAFAALSMMVNARDDHEMAELEAAHKRLKRGLGKVRVHGQKLAD